MRSHEINPQTYARIAGLCYLFIIFLGITGQILVRNSLLVPGDAAASVANLVAHPTSWRLGIMSDLLMHIFDIPLMVILYLLFKPINKNLAVLGLAFNIIQTAVLATNKLFLIVPLLMLGDSGYLAAFSAEQINSQIMLLVNLHNHGFALGLIFFGMACLVYGHLIFNSGYFPKVIGILICVAGISYLITSITLIVFPTYAALASALFLLCLIGEFSFCLWLLFKGINLPKWEAARKQLLASYSH